MSASDRIDCVVVGAGIVGIAVARQMAMAGHDVIVLEAEAAIGTHTSSRNSEVIHAGLYYPAGSLKASLCVAGREMLYTYCESRRVPFSRTGKMIVASQASEEHRLEDIAAAAIRNGVNNLQWLSASDIARLEPAVKGSRGLWSPSTGIIDSHALMLALRADLEAADGVISCRTNVSTVRVERDGFAVVAGDYTLHCRILINSAGPWAPQVASTIDGLASAHVPEAHYAKAHYFTYAGRSPFKTLVYPLPEDGGLGVHATLDMGGDVRFGPDVQWVEGIDYRFDESRKPAFVEAIRRYFPDLDPGRLQPGYTGIRPKLAGAGAPAADFVIQDKATHGISGLVNLFGIESPGLTASLAIAERVVALDLP